MPGLRPLSEEEIAEISAGSPAHLPAPPAPERSAGRSIGARRVALEIPMAVTEGVENLLPLAERGLRGYFETPESRAGRGDDPLGPGPIERWVGRVQPARRESFERLTGEEYVPPEELIPSERRGLTLGAGAAEAVLTGGPRGGLARGISERSIVPAAAEMAAGAGGALAGAEMPEDLGLAGTLAGAAAGGGLSGAGAEVVAGGLTLGRRAVSRGARTAANREAAAFELARRLGGRTALERNRERLREALAEEAEGLVPGRTTTAGALEPVSPSARAHEVTLGKEDEEFRAMLAAERQRNLGEFETYQRREFGGGEPAEAVSRYPAAAEAVRGDVTAAYGRFRAAPGARMVGVDTGPIKRAAAEARIMAEAGRGAGAPYLPTRILRLVDAMPDQDDLASLEAVRQAINNELARTGLPPTRGLHLRRLKESLDSAEEQAITRGRSLLSAMSLYGGRGDPVIAQRLTQMDEALRAAESARAARREAGRLLDDTGHPALVAGAGGDHDRVMARLLGAAPSELEAYVDTLRRLPRPEERRAALLGVERGFIRALEPAASREVGRTLSSLADLTPAEARRLAARLRDPEGTALARQARAALGATNPRRAAERVDQLARLVERVPELFGGEIDTPRVRVTTGTSTPDRAEQIFALVDEGRAGATRRMHRWLKDRVTDRSVRRKLIQEAMLDKAVAADLLANITPGRFAAWTARMENVISALALGGARAGGSGVRGLPAGLAGEEQR